MCFGFAWYWLRFYPVNNRVFATTSLRLEASLSLLNTAKKVEGARHTFVVTAGTWVSLDLHLEKLNGVFVGVIQHFQDIKGITGIMNIVETAKPAPSRSNTVFFGFFVKTEKETTAVRSERAAEGFFFFNFCHDVHHKHVEGEPCPPR